MGSAVASDPAAPDGVAAADYETAAMLLESSDPSLMVSGEDEVVLADTMACGDPWTDCARPILWAQGEYLLWWTKGMNVPALATTSPPGTPQDEAGVLGVRSTSILFGDGQLNDGSRSGGRVTLGYWIDAIQSRGFELTYLGLEDKSQTFTASGDDFSILARPFFNTQTNAQDARLIDFPNLVDGALAIDVTTEFQTAEVLARRSVSSPIWSSVDVYVGYRYAELQDAVRITESTRSLSGPIAGTSFQLSDEFSTRNEFHGAEAGVRVTRCSSPLMSIEFLGKFALGNTSSQATLAGITNVTAPTGETTTQPAGLLVQSTNRGTFNTSEFSALGEAAVTLRRQFGAGWSGTFGYTFFFWTDVVRAGEQIDTSVNVTQIPPGTLQGEPSPSYPAETVDFWAQGLRLGLEYNF